MNIFNDQIKEEEEVNSYCENTIGIDSLYCGFE